MSTELFVESQEDSWVKAGGRGRLLASTGIGATAGGSCFGEVKEEVLRAFVADSAELCEPNWASRLSNAPPLRFLGVMGSVVLTDMRGRSMVSTSRAAV